MADQPSTTSSGTVCHVLPCSIEEDRTAPIAHYFRPTPLPEEAVPEDARRDDVTIVAAQFRGRGLLSAVDSPTTGDKAEASSAPALSALPSTMVGVALAPSTGGHAPPSTSAKDPPARPLKVVERFRHVYHWSHEHDVRKVVRERHGNEKTGLGAAVGWCELAREVHDPIPVPP